MPIYKGGNLFLGALNSIETSGIAFSNIVVSFNGEDAADHDAFIQAQRDGRLKNNYIVFQTESEMDAVRHALFILEQIKGILEPDTMLFLLAHDDRILHDEGSHSTIHFLRSLDRNTVYFPSYSCCMAGSYERITKVIEQELLLTPEQFFWLTLKENIATNMSGMITPLHAWEEALNVLASAGSGARFEHLLCIASRVQAVSFHRNVRVLVGERTDSDGKRLTSLQHRKAALAYLLAFARNGRLRGQHRYLAYFLEISKRFVALTLCKGQLLFLFRIR